MNRQKLSMQVMWAILLTLMLVGCGASAATPTQEIEVTFNGNECTVSGPSEIPIGERPIILNDLSDMNMRLFVSRLIDGKTFQDLLDLQSEPGELYPAPSWVVDAQKYSASDSEDSIYVLDEPGEYALYVYSLSPEILWLCAPRQVIEAPIE